MLLKDILFAQSITYSSNPSPYEEHQTHTVARTPKDDQAHITPPCSSQNLPSKRNAKQSANADTREACCEISPIVLGPTQLAGADRAEGDVTSRRKPIEQGERYDQAFRSRRRRHKGERKPESENCDHAQKDHDDHGVEPPNFVGYESRSPSTEEGAGVQY